MSWPTVDARLPHSRHSRRRPLESSLPRPAADYQLGYRYELPGSGLTVRIERADTLAEGEPEQLLKLFARAFNGGPSWFALPVPPRQHLEWKTLGPYGPALFSLLEDGRRIVGSTTYVRRRYRLSGVDVDVSEGHDAALDLEYQGRGLTYPRADLQDSLGLRADACFSVAYGTHPISRIRRGVRQSHTIVAANAVQSLVRPLGLRALVAASRSRRLAGGEGSSRTRGVLDSRTRRPLRADLPKLLAAGRLAWSALRTPPNTRPPRLRISTIESFDERADELWRRAAVAFQLAQARDRAYLNWRFCDPRSGSSYVVRIAEDGDELLGYAVLRLTPSGAVLDDLLAVTGRLDVVRVLVADALAVAEHEGANFVRSWLAKSHPYREALLRLGFVSHPTVLHFACRHHGCDLGELAFLADPHARIHVMTGDTDHL